LVPSQGYATIGLKPAILSKLQKDTDEFYPGMFLPSALIIMMNEVKRGFYSVEMQNVKADFSGRYTSLTIRSDVKRWLEESYERLEEDYDRKYKANSFTKFAGIFMLNTFESKAAAQGNIIKLKEADFRWLVEEYDKRKQEYKTKHGVQNFEQFTDVFLKELLEKVNAAKRILTL
jgi:tRNA(Met) C34 N-acetyltransferase TmcA